MNTDKLKDLAAPTLAKAKEEQNLKIDDCFALVGEVKKVLDNILVEKTRNNREIKEAGIRRTYILVTGASITALVGFLDVLKLNDGSEIIGRLSIISKAVLSWFI